MLYRYSLVLSALLLAACAQKAPSDQVTLEKDVLMDKIRGAWAGQVIGCTYGGPTEFKFSGFISDEYAIDWNDHIVKWWYDNTPGLYDDVYMDLTFVEVFEKEGLDAPVESFAKAFAARKLAAADIVEFIGIIPLFRVHFPAALAV